MISQSDVEAGKEALARGAWNEAHDLFDRATQHAVTAEALEGLATARWWLFDLPGAIAVREQAFNIYKEKKDTMGAARMALWIASDHNDRGDDAIANGWLRRAERLLENDSTTPEHAFYSILRGHIALMGKSDVATATMHAHEGVIRAQQANAIDFEMLALALEGLCLVTRGDVGQGMTQLDEATAAATGGEMTDLVAIGWTCCYLIHACYRVRDYNRAAQWCDRVQTFCRRWSFDSMFTTCRTHYASILMWRGDLAEAEQELAFLQREAADRLPPLVKSSIVRMGELRRRQGRLQEAAELFAQAPDHKLSVLGRAALALDLNKPEESRDLLIAFLRRIPDDARTDRLPALETLVPCQLALGDLEGAAKSVSELKSIAEVLGGETLRASLEAAEGLLFAARGDTQSARRALEDAVYLYERNDAQYEAARARQALARLRSSDTPPSTPQTGAAQLTKREIEILRLIADGLTDKEVAGALSISDHTVHRHVANILTKTGQSSRAAAVAYAARSNIL